VEFARDVIDRLEYEQYIQKVYLTKRGKISDSLAAKNPVDIHIVFRQGDVTEGYVNAYLTTQIKQLLISSEMVNAHIAEPGNTPLDFSLTRNRDGIYEANIHTFAIPRHPAQLYESFSSLLLFFLLFFLWKKHWKTLADGRIFGLFMLILFSLRFGYEFLKENQVDFENGMKLNMGQWLSIPLILFGIYLLVRKGSRSEVIPTVTDRSIH
jgi:prolipoprotein diacylglyceryltransferase